MKKKPSLALALLWTAAAIYWAYRLLSRLSSLSGFSLLTGVLALCGFVLLAALDWALYIRSKKRR